MALLALLMARRNICRKKDKTIKTFKKKFLLKFKEGELVKCDVAGGRGGEEYEHLLGEI